MDDFIVNNSLTSPIYIFFFSTTKKKLYFYCIWNIHFRTIAGVNVFGRNDKEIKMFPLMRFTNTSKEILGVKSHGATVED